MDELLDWRAYERLEPFGEERGDVRCAITTAAILNVHRGSKTAPIQPSAIMPRFDADYLPKKDSVSAIAELATKIGAKNG